MRKFETKINRISSAVVVPVQTQHVSTPTEFAETLFMQVQRTLAPRKPMSSTEWCLNSTIDSLHGSNHDLRARAIRESYWRVLIQYAVRDLASNSCARLAFANLAATLNHIRMEQGVVSVRELVGTIEAAQDRFPESFV